MRSVSHARVRLPGWGRIIASAVCLSLLACVMLALAAVAYAVTFTGPTNFAAGDAPGSVAVGDFNADPDPDLAVANRASDNVSVLLGGAGGSFTGPTNFAAGDAPGSVAVGDFNADSDPDLAVANRDSDNVSVLLGGDAGGFSGPTNLAAGDGPSAVAVGHFNADSDPDLAVSNLFSDNVSVLLGGAGASFSGPTNFAAGDVPGSVAVGDFNADSDPDLAVPNRGSANVSVLFGGDGGSFGGPTNFGVGTTPISVAIGDFNADSHRDLAVANFSSDNVSVLLGGGNGSFGAAVNFGVGDGPVSVAVGSFDADLDPDLAVANQGNFGSDPGSVSVLLGAAGGGFTGPTNFAADNAPGSVTVGDFDAGSGADLAVANQGSDNVSVLLQDGPPAPPTVTGTDPASPANNNNPKVKGTAEAGSTVKVYTAPTTSDCTPANLVATGTAADFASPGLAVSVPENSTTRFRATATDGDGNTSACSETFIDYTEDSTPPAAPTLTGTDPASPADNNFPKVKGTAEANSTVTLYEAPTTADCTPANQNGFGTAAHFASPGLAVSVADNSTTRFRATATDAAGNTSACSTSSIVYRETPAPPTLTATDPASPANNNSPKVKGTAEAGSTVRLYRAATTADCTAANLAATGTAAAFASPGLAVSVADNSATRFRATATAGGNTSSCSASSIVYTEDSTPPAAPTLTATDPASPANNNSPKVKGTAAAGSTVRLYKAPTTSDCTPANLAATGTAGAFASPGLAVSVPDDSTTRFRATATDAAGNVSGCSASSIVYVESTPALGDFNGDGRADLAVGVRGEDVGTVSDAGAVNVLYGTAGGLSAVGNQLWHQDSAGVLDATEGGDEFGFSLAAGDFNGDGRADLAVGAHLEDIGTIGDAGAVHILYGSAGGLSTTGNQVWHQNSAGVQEAPEPGDMFGEDLAAGDLNGDGRADLAVGVPGEDAGPGQTNVGVVNVLYGSAGGLTSTGNHFWSQGSSGVLGDGGAGDMFGEDLAAGDLNGDRRADLAVGVPFEDVGTVSNAGAVNVLYGTAAGLSATGNQLWHQNSLGVLDTAEGGDNFGFTLAAGHLNGDGRADLAVGVPLENVGTVSDAGAVNVLYGTAAGLSATGNQLWHQNSTGILDDAQSGDIFGGEVAAAGDLNGDGRADLAVGVPFEDIGTVSNAGAFNVLYGTAAGLSATSNQFWHQDSTGILDTAEPDDEFGGELAAGDFNDNGRADLAVGARLENIGAISNAGAANVLYGAVGGLSATTNQFWHQDSPSVLDDAQPGDDFGFTLAAGD